MHKKLQKPQHVNEEFGQLDVSVKFSTNIYAWNLPAKMTRITVRNNDETVVVKG